MLAQHQLEQHTFPTDCNLDLLLDWSILLDVSVMLS